MEKVLQSLETFRTAAVTAVDLAKPVAERVAVAARQEKLPPPGRLMTGRLLRMIALNPLTASSSLPARASPSTKRCIPAAPGNPDDGRMMSG
ncbi:MAG TPA: hypothetical protein VN493_17305 [Thermoanaerobaculia bacterium]|nr:hypothetical protein [Thermoanaerobaculia bacterium]